MPRGYLGTSTSPEENELRVGDEPALEAKAGDAKDQPIRSRPKDRLRCSPGQTCNSHFFHTLRLRPACGVYDAITRRMPGCQVAGDRHRSHPGLARDPHVRMEAAADRQEQDLVACGTPARIPIFPVALGQ